VLRNIIERQAKRFPFDDGFIETVDLTAGGQFNLEDIAGRTGLPDAFALFGLDHLI
jgi:hypothetical protein